MLTPQQQAALDVAAPAAVACQTATKLPAALSIGQWAVESSWGKNMPGNNCFGIKANGGKTQLLATTEWFTDAQLLAFLALGEGRTARLRQPLQVSVSGTRRLYDVMDLFAAYDSLADCFADHARLLTTAPVYAPAWDRYLSDGNVDALIQGIAHYYATAPNYFTIVDQIAHSSAIVAAIAKARQAGG